MTLEELLTHRVILRIKPNHSLALSSVKHAFRDIDTAKKLIVNEELDWSLAVSYNAMLSAGRALMFNQGYRPSSTEGHVAVVSFLQAALGSEGSDRMITLMNGLRKKRHRIVYEAIDVVSKDEAAQAIEWAQEFVKVIDEMIQESSSDQHI